MTAHGRQTRDVTVVLWVMLVAIPLAVAPESIQPGYYPKLFLLHAGLAVLAGYAILRRAAFLGSPLVLPAALFLLFNAVSISQSVNRVESVVVLSHRLALLSTLLLGTALLDTRHLSRLFAVLGVASAVTAAIGIAQYAGWFGLSLPTSGMPSSTFGYRNFAAAFTVAAIPFVAAEALRTPDARRRALWTAVLFLNGAFLIATRARAAWGACAVSVVVALALVAWRRRREPRPDLDLRRLFPLAGAVALAIAFSAVVPPRMGGAGYDVHSVEKVTVTGSIAATFEPGSDKNRFTIWGHTLDMIATSPLTGVGLGNWQYVYPDFDRGDVTWKAGSPQRPHNDYLWVAAETGLLGFVAFLWLAVVAALAAFRAVVSAGRDVLLYVVAAVASLVAVGLHGVFSFPLERIPATFLVALSLAVIALADPATRRLRLPNDAHRFVWPVLLACQLLATVIAWRGVAFDRIAWRQSAAIARQDWDGAIRFGTEALALGVFDPQVLLERGLAQHMAGRFDAAIADQRACLTYHPYFVNAVNNLGMSLNAAGRFDEAIDVLERIGTLDPDHVEAHLNLARSYAGRSQPAEALAELEKAHEKGPKRVDILSELARLYEGAGDLDAAAGAIEKAITLKPERFGLTYRLGVIRQKQGRLADAETLFSRVVAMEPGYVPVQFNLGELHLARGDTAAALAAYGRFVNRWQGAQQVADAVRKRIASLQ